MTEVTTGTAREYVYNAKNNIDMLFDTISYMEDKIGELEQQIIGLQSENYKLINNKSKPKKDDVISYKQQKNILSSLDEFNKKIINSKSRIQDIGLKDKNGKKIYEGDIIIYEGSEKFIIQYVKDKFVATQDGYNYDIGDGCEVVGNVYEDPNDSKD